MADQMNTDLFRSIADELERHESEVAMCETATRQVIAKYEAAAKQSAQRFDARMRDLKSGQEPVPQNRQPTQSEPCGLGASQCRHGHILGRFLEWIRRVL